MASASNPIVILVFLFTVSVFTTQCSVNSLDWVHSETKKIQGSRIRKSRLLSGCQQYSCFSYSCYFKHASCSLIAINKDFQNDAVDLDSYIGRMTTTSRNVVEEKKNITWITPCEYDYVSYEKPGLELLWSRHLIHIFIQRRVWFSWNAIWKLFGDLFTTRKLVSSSTLVLKANRRWNSWMMADPLLRA